jgi:diguanylate cyclase (GGDEF)-like protein
MLPMEVPLETPDVVPVPALAGSAEAPARVDALNERAWELRMLDAPRSARVADEALALAEAEGYAAGIALALRTLGNHDYLSRADYDGATARFHRALALLEEADDPRGRGDVLNGIGNVHWRRGEYPEAMRMHLRALELQRAQGDRAGEGHSLNALGNVSYHLGDYAQALDYYQASLKLRETGSRDGEATCLRDIGKIHERRGQVDRALECYVASLEITRQLGARVFEAETLVPLGALRVRMGEVEQGVRDLHDALEIGVELGARPQVYMAHEALQAVYESRGELDLALSHFRAFHAVWRDVFNAETNARIKSVLVRAEVQQAQREAEILRQKNDELTAAYDRLRQADEEKAGLVGQLREQAVELERQTREDALTGVSNRRHLDALLAVEWERALRFGRALTVAMLDLDHFKLVNDRYSHAVGDEVLRTVARILCDSTRGVDVVARYGGEEFCLILVETRLEEGARLCDRLLRLVESHDWAALRPGLAVTITAGVAGLHEADAPNELLAAADVRLYAAKHQGRNRVCAD